MSKFIADPETKALWRRNWLESLTEFADLALQQRSWFGGPGFESPYWSFVEFNCRYFDDYSLSAGYKEFVQDGYLTQSEADAVAAFHEAADQYKSPRGDDYDHVSILADPKWLNVVRLAGEAKAALLPLLHDPNELAILYPHEG